MIPPAMTSSPEVWLLVFQQVAGDYVTLCNISLVSRAWRTLSWPCLLQVVDLSSHNIERRLTERENSILPVIYSHHHAKYRPKNLVPRQRAFLSLITAQPDLAKHVKTFTWTLVWKDAWDAYDCPPLLDIDRETWNVFARLLNVTQLDLASIHEIWEEDIVRENPILLFPKVTDLRLLGWMHRGLVRAILGAIDKTRLRSLRLDYLEDQGTLPGGHLLNAEVAMDFAKTARRASISDEEHIIDDTLFRLQEMGEVAVFPGPMWLPLRMLSGCPLDSLSHLQITVPHFDLDIDLRNYYTTFHEAAMLLRRTSNSLRSLVVTLGESTRHYCPQINVCGTSRVHYRFTYLPWCIKMAAAFLKQILIALSETQFQNLTQLTFEGFHLLESEEAGADLGGTLPYILNNRFNVNFTGTSHVDGRLIFGGFDCAETAFNEDIIRHS